MNGGGKERRVCAEYLPDVIVEMGYDPTPSQLRKAMKSLTGWGPAPAGAPRTPLKGREIVYPADKVSESCD